MPFDATGRMAAAIPFPFDDYLELVDSTGRVIHEDTRGHGTTGPRYYGTATLLALYGTTVLRDSHFACAGWTAPAG